MALRAIKMAKTPAQARIDSRLYLALLKEKNDPRLAPLKAFRFMKPDADGRFPVEIVATGTTSLNPVAARVSSLGAPVTGVSRARKQVSARVRLGDLEALAATPGVKRVRTPVPARTQKVIHSEGDVTHGADTARSFYGFDGTGVKVCVLSDGVDSLVTSQMDDELPDVDVLPGQDGSGDEGTALLEIIHDLAPGASLAFATGTTDEASFAQNILDLAAANCSIIMDDVYYADESPFQDGPAAQAIDTVTAQGILYFAPAGNEGNLATNSSSTWEGDFSPSAAVDPAPLAGANLHDFGDGANSILVAFGGDNAPVLIWAESYDLENGSAATDFDLYLMNGALTEIEDASTDTQDGTGGDDFPIEYISTAAASGERLLIDKFASGTTSSTPMMHLSVSVGNQVWSARGLDPDLATGGAITGHAGAVNATTVAATAAGPSFDGQHDGPYPSTFGGNSTQTVEVFSSDGPRRILLSPAGLELTPGNRTSTGGVVRQKPEVTAADGVSTSLGGDFDPFYGTSAAAAHAAGIAALLKAAVPTATAAQIRSALAESAIDIHAPGVDSTSGAGVIMAVAALEALDASPAIKVALTATPNPSTFDDLVTFTATVGGQTPTGTVAFFDGATLLDTAEVGNGSASISTAALGAGMHSIQARYSGDSDDMAANSSAILQTVEKRATTLQFVSNFNPQVVGQPVDLIAGVAPANSTGVVTFSDSGTMIGTANVGADGIAKVTTSDLAIGTHFLSAVYAGDDNHTNSTGLVLVEYINPATTNIVLTSSANPSAFGDTVDFTAATTLDAGGTITFRDRGVLIGVFAIDGGNATATLSNLSVGTHAITAEYSGDPTHAYSATAPLAQVVNKATSTIDLASSLNPSTANASVTFTATIAPAAATGAVTFFNGDHSIGTGDLSGGVATVTTTSLVAGAHTITAQYAGDDLVSAVNSTELTQNVTATELTATTTTLSAAPASPVFGQAITFTATVAPSGATGNVVFQEGDAVLGTVAVVSGTATFTTSALAGGSHTLTATYGGSGAFAASSSEGFVQAVGGAAITATLTSTPNPAATASTTITFTGTVSSTAGTPTGAVAVLEGETVIVSGTLTNGMVTLTGHLPAGTHSLRLGYQGNASFAQGVSPVLSQVVAGGSGSDAGVADAGTGSTPDARPGSDGGTSTVHPDAATDGGGSSSDGGCSCSVGGHESGASDLLSGLFVVGLFFARRRRLF